MLPSSPRATRRGHPRKETAAGRKCGGSEAREGSKSQNMRESKSEAREGSKSQNMRENKSEAREGGKISKSERERERS